MSSDEINTKTRILEVTWHLLEKHHGQGVKMGDIAKAAGISRQAVYLHFASRTELLIATMNYVDEVKGLNQRFEQFNSAKSGIERLEACIDVWCNYIPEIYGMAKAMLMVRDTDEAMAAAWNNGMNCLREVCQASIDALKQEGKLAPKWSTDEATDILMTMLSINNWEQLTIEYGWPAEHYIRQMKMLLRSALVNNESSLHANSW